MKRWRYEDHVTVGSPDGPSRPFQTMVELEPGGAWSKNEFQYGYDLMGRMTAAGFAMTPSASAPPTQSWYSFSQNAPPITRARATYSYDAAGRLLDLSTWWDQFSPDVGGTWVATEQFRAQNTATYEARGLKQTSFLKDSQWDPTGRTETYSYEPLRDHLASVNYGDQSPTQTWSYDFAGNRSTNGEAAGR